MIFSSLLLVIIFVICPHFSSLLFWLSWDFLFSVFSRMNSSALNQRRVIYRLWLNTRSAVGRQQWASSWPNVYQHLVRRWTATINGYWLLCASVLARCITTHDCTITWRHIKATPCLTSLTRQLVSCSRLSVFSSLLTRASARSVTGQVWYALLFSVGYTLFLCCVLFSDGGWCRYWLLSHFYVVS